MKSDARGLLGTPAPLSLRPGSNRSTSVSSTSPWPVGGTSGLRPAPLTMGKKKKRKRDLDAARGRGQVDWNDPWDAFVAVRQEEQAASRPPTGAASDRGADGDD